MRSSYKAVQMKAEDRAAQWQRACLACRKPWIPPYHVKNSQRWEINDYGALMDIYFLTALALLFKSAKLAPTGIHGNCYQPDR